MLGKIVTITKLDNALGTIKQVTGSYFVIQLHKSQNEYVFTRDEFKVEGE